MINNYTHLSPKLNGVYWFHPVCHPLPQGLNFLQISSKLDGEITSLETTDKFDLVYHFQVFEMQIFLELDVKIGPS